MGRPHESQRVVDFRTLDGWRQRRVVLERKLKDEADHEWAWLWELRVQLIDYLLSRYDEGDEPGRKIVRLNQPPRTPTPAMPDRAERTEPFIIEPPATPPSVPADYPGRPATERSTLRRRLDSLAQANKQRHAANDLERKRLITEAKALLEADQQFAEEVRAMKEEVRQHKAGPRVLIEDREAKNISALLEMSDQTELAKLIIDDMDDEMFYEFMTSDDANDATQTDRDQPDSRIS